MMPITLVKVIFLIQSTNPNVSLFQRYSFRHTQKQSLTNYLGVPQLEQVDNAKINYPTYNYLSRKVKTNIKIFLDMQKVIKRQTQILFKIKWFLSTVIINFSINAYTTSNPHIIFIDELKAFQSGFILFFTNVCVSVCVCLLGCFSSVQLLVILWTVAIGFSVHGSLQDRGSKLPCLAQDLPDPGIESSSLTSCSGRQVLYHQCHLGKPLVFTPWPRS